MAQATVNPFADPDTQAAADTETSDFLTNEELIGRNLIVVPISIETVKGEGQWPDGRDKKDYQRVTADIIVLDGRRNPKIKSFPHTELNKYVTATKIVAELRKYVGTGTPVVGYFTQVNKGYFLEKPDPDVKDAPATLKAWQVYTQQGPVQSQEPPF